MSAVCTTASNHRCSWSAVLIVTSPTPLPPPQIMSAVCTTASKCLAPDQLGAAATALLRPVLDMLRQVGRTGRGEARKDGHAETGGVRGQGVRAARCDGKDMLRQCKGEGKAAVCGAKGGGKDMLRQVG